MYGKHFLQRTALWLCLCVGFFLISDTQGLTIINDCIGLQAIKNNLTGNYQLGGNINCTDTVNWNGGAGFEPLGNNYYPFVGSLNGQGFEIFELTINRPGVDNVGLFGYTGPPAHINSVGLVDSLVSGGNNVGGLVGYNNLMDYNKLASMSNIYTTGSVLGSGGCVGGLMGWSRAVINNAYSTCYVSGSGERVGGLIGNAYFDSSISNAYATGQVSGSSNHVGGLAGYTSDTAITNAYATGPVSGGSNVGGLIGNAYESASPLGSIIDIYATGQVSGAGDYIGGLVGFCQIGSVINAYATGNVSGSSQVGGLLGHSYATVSYSYATGSVLGLGNSVAGLVGYTQGGMLKSVYATGSASSSGYYVGGLVGYNGASVTNAYSIGAVSSSSGYAGGLIGYNPYGSATNSYWDIQTSGCSISAAGTGKNTAELYQQITFVNWDFTTIWWINNTYDYPKLLVFIIRVAHPLPSKSNSIGQLFLMQVPNNTIVDMSGLLVTYTASLQNGGSLPLWLTFNGTIFSAIPLSGAQGSYPIKVTGTNTRGQSLSNGFTLTILNRSPIQNTSLVNKAVGVGTMLSYTFAANTFLDPDPDLDLLTYQTQRQGGGALPTWLSFQNTTHTFSGTPQSGEQGTIMVSVIVTDGHGGRITASFSITVTNRAPVVQIPLGSITATKDQLFQWIVPASHFIDPDGDSLTFVVNAEGGGPLPGWLTYSTATKVLMGTPEQRGTYPLQVNASDSFGGQVTAAFAIVVPNAPPYVLNPIPQQAADVGQLFKFIIPADTFVDPNHDALTLTVSQPGGSIPHWLRYDAANHTLSGTPDSGDTDIFSDRRYLIAVTASDAQGGSAMANFDLLVRGESTVEWAIKILGILGTVGGIVLAAYRNRAWIWNHTAKRWYQLPPQYTIITQDYTWIATLPKRTQEKRIQTIKVYRQNHEVEGPTGLPGWMTYEAKVNKKNKTHQIKGKPQADDIDELDVRVFSEGGATLASFPLAIVNNEEEGQSFITRMTSSQTFCGNSKNCASLLPTCLNKTKPSDKQMSLLNSEHTNDT